MTRRRDRAVVRRAGIQTGEIRSAIFSTDTSCTARLHAAKAVMLAIVVSAMLRRASAVKKAWPGDQDVRKSQQTCEHVVGNDAV